MEATGLPFFQHVVRYAAGTIGAVAGFEALRDLVQHNLIKAGVFARRTIELGMEI
jgi:hypothetical protein